MPRIPTYTAEPRAGVLQLPQTVPVPSYTQFSQFGADITRFSEQLSKISEKLQNQQDEIDIGNLNGRHDARIKELQLEVNKEILDPIGRTKEFTRRARAMQHELASSTNRREVLVAFKQHVARNFPIQAITYHANNLELQEKQQIATIDAAEDKLSRSAALAETPAERDEFIATHERLVTAGEANTLFDAVETEKRRQRFREKVELNFMDILRMRDPDRLFELEEQGAFAGVDPIKRVTIIDRATREHAARAAQGQATLDKAMKTWVESIERETAVHIGARTLTQEWIEEYRYALSSEKVEAYSKALREQRLGISGGDPLVEREMLADVNDPNLDPRKTLARLTTLYRRNAISLNKYEVWAPKLSATIVRQDGETRVVRNEVETRKRELQGRRYDSARRIAALAFNTTNQYEDFDASATEALAQFLDELDRRADYIGGDEDSREVLREILPKYIVQVDMRTESRLAFLESQLLHKDRPSLKAARARIGEVAYENQARIFEEIHGIKLARTRLDAFRRQQTDVKPVPKKERFTK